MRDANLLHVKQRLVLPVNPKPGESLVGLIISATHANGLGRPKFILSKIGVQLAHIGTIGQYLREREAHLAWHLGCDLNEIVMRSHPYVDAEETLVRWGDGLMRRTDLVLDRRRIAPGALGRSDYHRAAWQCRHLPFDPSTLELLVDRCTTCSTVLRWNVTRGIDTCEHCRNPVNASSIPRLDGRLAKSYRGFAGLISIESSIRDRSRAHLTPVLADLPQPLLLDLILGIGLVAGSQPKLLGRRTFANLNPHQRATASVLGYELTRNWPYAMQGAISSMSDAAVNQGTANTFVNALKGMISERSMPSRVAQLMREVLPEVALGSRRMVGAFAGGVVLASEISKSAGIRMAQVAHLKETGVLPYFLASGCQRQNTQFNQTEALAFIKAWRSSQTIAQVASALGIPHYAVWQLLWNEELKPEANVGVKCLDKLPRIGGNHWAIWLDKLKSKAGAQIPANAITLHVAMRRCGGGFKNWSGALQMLRLGCIPFWWKDAGTSAGIAKHIFVGDEVTFGERIQDLQLESKLLITCPLVNQADACDILNLDPLQIRALVKNDILAFEKSGKGLTTSTQDVLSYAKRTIAASELGHLLGVRNDAAHARISARAPVKRVPGGWPRTEVETL